MNAHEFRDCLKTLGWSQRYLSVALGTHKTTVQRWSQGKQPIPRAVEEWLRRLASFHRENPLPAGWITATSSQDEDTLE